MDTRFNEVETRMDTRFNQMEARIEERFDGLQRSMIITLASILAAFAALFAAAQF
jgi:hypothetical protein